MNPTIKHLKRARALIAKGWCQHRYAKDASGLSCSLWSRKAKRFCILGALIRATPSDSLTSTCENALCDTIKLVDPSFIGLTLWNDNPTRTKDEVLKLFDDTIKRLEGAKA